MSVKGMRTGRLNEIRILFPDHSDISDGNTLKVVIRNIKDQYGNLWAISTTQKAAIVDLGPT